MDARLVVIGSQVVLNQLGDTPVSILTDTFRGGDPDPTIRQEVCMHMGPIPEVAT